MANPLPNPPLTEVVFELHWALHAQQKGLLDVLKFDPGFFVCAEQFAKKISRLGFKIRKEERQFHEIAGRSVLYRFYRDAKKTFPLVQIGPGVFASNMAAEYEWRAFRNQTLKCVKAVLEAYPRLKEFSFCPTYLELRYVNAFDSKVLDNKSIQEFCDKSIDLGFNIPKFLEQSKLVGDLVGIRNVYSFPLKSERSTFFDLDLASGSRDNDPIIQQISKVRCTKPPGRIGRGTAQYINRLERWLENAHNVTSPFFRNFVSRDLLQEFEKEIN